MSAPKTMDQMRAELDAEHAAALAAHALKLERLQKFADAGLPLPEYVGGLVHGALHVTYRNDWQKGPRSLRDAVALMERFRIVPAHVLKSGCTMFHPEPHLPAKEAAQGYKRDPYRSAAYACQLRVGHIIGSPAPTSARLEFFAMVSGLLCCVDVDFGTGYIGSCPQLAPRVITRTGHHSSTVEGFEPRPCLHSADARINYGGNRGPNGLDSSDMRFLFAADHDEEGTTVQHAAEALRNIADEVKA